MNVGKLVRLAALNVGAAVNVGAAGLPVKFPNTVFAAAVESVNVRAGVEVAVATEVVNSGDSVPALKLVTVPAPAGVAHVASPRQKVVELALVPLFNCVTGIFPEMSAKAG